MKTIAIKILVRDDCSVEEIEKQLSALSAIKRIPYCEEDSGELESNKESLA